MDHWGMHILKLGYFTFFITFCSNVFVGASLESNHAISNRTFNSISASSLISAVATSEETDYVSKSSTLCTSNLNEVVYNALKDPSRKPFFSFKDILHLPEDNHFCRFAVPELFTYKESVKPLIPLAHSPSYSTDVSDMLASLTELTNFDTNLNSDKRDFYQKMTNVGIVLSEFYMKMSTDKFPLVESTKTLDVNLQLGMPVSDFLRNYQYMIQNKSQFFDVANLTTLSYDELAKLNLLTAPFADLVAVDSWFQGLDFSSYSDPMEDPIGDATLRADLDRHYVTTTLFKDISSKVIPFVNAYWNAVNQMVDLMYIETFNDEFKRDGDNDDENNEAPPSFAGIAATFSLCAPKLLSFNINGLNRPIPSNSEQLMNIWRSFLNNYQSAFKDAVNWSTSYSTSIHKEAFNEQMIKNDLLAEMTSRCTAHLLYESFTQTKPVQDLFLKGVPKRPVDSSVSTSSRNTENQSSLNELSDLLKMMWNQTMDFDSLFSDLQMLFSANVDHNDDKVKEAKDKYLKIDTVLLLTSRMESLLNRMSNQLTTASSPVYNVIPLYLAMFMDSYQLNDPTFYMMRTPNQFLYLPSGDFFVPPSTFHHAQIKEVLSIAEELKSFNTIIQKSFEKEQEFLVDGAYTAGSTNYASFYLSKINDAYSSTADHFALLKVAFLKATALISNSISSRILYRLVQPLLPTDKYSSMRSASDSALSSVLLSALAPLKYFEMGWQEDEVKGEDKKLSTGAIVGIVVGGVFAIVALTVVTIVLYKKLVSSKQLNKTSDNPRPHSASSSLHSNSHLSSVIGREAGDVYLNNSNNNQNSSNNEPDIRYHLPPINPEQYHHRHVYTEGVVIPVV